MKKYILRAVSIVCLVLATFSVVQAFGAGPSIHTSLAPNHTKEVQVTASRAYVGPRERVTVKIGDTVRDIVSIKPGASLYIEEGERYVKIPLLLRATDAQLGTHKGEITIGQAPEQAAENSSNLIEVPLDVEITVSNDQSGALSLSGNDYRWNAATNEVILRFNINNERTYDSGVTKVGFSIVKNGAAPVETEIETKQNLVPSETTQNYALSLPVGSDEYGFWEINAKYYDEKGMLISEPFMQTVYVNPPRTEHMKRVRMFVYVIAAALGIAALFMGDYYYLRRKYGGSAHRK